MSLSNYTDLQTALTNWMARSDLTALYPDWIHLFESWASRRLRCRQMETVVLLQPSNPPVLTVTGAAAHTGLIQLTVTSNTTLQTGDEATVTGVLGTTEANGVWTLTRIDATHVDLQNSTFTNAYVSGGTIQEFAGIAALPADYASWRRVTWTGSPRQELQYVHPTNLFSEYPSLPSGPPQYFTIYGSNLRVSPTSAANLEFDYFQAIPSLQTNTTNWLMTLWPDIYLFGSLTESYWFQKDPDKYNAVKARRDEIASEINMFDLRTRAGGAMRPQGVRP